jgi:hypothetical protein
MVLTDRGVELDPGKQCEVTPPTLASADSEPDHLRKLTV